MKIKVEDFKLKDCGFKFIGDSKENGIIDIDLREKTIEFLEDNDDPDIPSINFQRIRIFIERLGEKITEPYLVPSIPTNVPDPIYKGLIIPALESRGAILKKDLEIGIKYLGECRNSETAIWLGDKFEYDRYKFGTTFKETINHFEDDDGYDLFVPIKRLD